MWKLRDAAALSAPLLFAACAGGGGGSPTAPPPPAPTYSVSVVVFYDEDADGRLDAAEQGRLPGVVVEVAGRRATTAVLTGRASLGGVPGGQATATVRPESLPPFYVAGAGVPVDVPTELEIELPVTLPIGGNHPNLYMAFGDSITEGEGSSDGRGYVRFLEDRLRATLGAGEVRMDAASGTTSREGAARLGARLNRNRPAYTLIHYGTNDWNFCDDVASCYTLDSLRQMVVQVKAFQGLPVLATIMPVNVGYDARVPPRRNEWVAEADREIRELARAEGALLVDLEAAFLREAGGNLAQLFADHVHPNDRGYEVMADEFFRALTQPAAQAASASARDTPAPGLGPSLDAPAPAPPSPGRRPRPSKPWSPEPLSLEPLGLRPLPAPGDVRAVTRGRGDR